MGDHRQIMLVGPGSELQLTLDGRAVPHAEVVSARAALPPDAAGTPPAPAGDDAPVVDGQTSL